MADAEKAAAPRELPRDARAAKPGLSHHARWRRARDRRATPQDVLAEVEATSLGEQLDRRSRRLHRARSSNAWRAGLHLVAEIKRASPSAGRIAQGNEDIVGRARAYEAGGAAAISVLCEPHWFGGSLADLRAVRAAVSIPVLAKEFVVEDIQLPMLRAAGADLVLLLAVLHPPKRLAARRTGLAIGLEPLVEAHDEKELRAALATDARLIGLNNRNLRTLDVDPIRADLLRSLVPDDRLVIAESGVRDPSVVARWRALGFDGALVGEALMRSADPAAAVRSFVAAGRAPTIRRTSHADPSSRSAGSPTRTACWQPSGPGRTPSGSTSRPNHHAGWSWVRRRSWPGSCVAAPAERRPAIVAVVADPGPEEVASLVTAPILTRSSGQRTRRIAGGNNLAPPGASCASRRRTTTTVLPCLRERLSRLEHMAGGAARVLIDAASATARGGPAGASAAGAAAIARQVPAVLAGGLDPANVAEALRAIPAVGVDVASGVEASRVPGERPQGSVPRRTFVKRAKAARDDRPNTAFGPTPVHPALLEADAAGRWGWSATSAAATCPRR